MIKKILITSFVIPCILSSTVYISSAKMSEIKAKPTSEVWLPLMEKLAKDDISSEELNIYFSKLPEIPSEKPMGLKIKELYTSAYLEKPKVEHVYDIPSDEFDAPGPWYKDVVTKANALKCYDFMQSYDEAFETAEKKYSVPKEVLAALIFVETRLGLFVGKDNAFVTLASMSISDDISLIPSYVNELPDVSEDISQIRSYTDELPDVDGERVEWINAKMQARSEWAYKEFRALVQHFLQNNLDPFEIPGSIYGAIGLCQFMPTNLDMYATDGNRDGIVNLFDPEDAIMSAAKYLQKHGWKKYSSTGYKQKILKRYNNHIVYANTILGLAEQIEILEESMEDNKE